MSKNKKIFGIINFFDIIIILVVVCVAAGLYLFTNKEVVVETKPLVYTLEITDLPTGFSENISVGDNLTDNVKNYHMGKVVKAEAVPSTKITNDYTNSKIVESVVPERENVIITVEANVTESESDFKVDGSYVVKAGKEVSIKGPGYAGVGYILTVER